MTTRVRSQRLFWSLGHPRKLKNSACVKEILKKLSTTVNLAGWYSQKTNKNLFILCEGKKKICEVKYNTPY